MPRNKYPEETRKKILESATRLLFEKGYDNTSLQDIIDDTKLSKGAIYHHFDSKDSILLAVYDRISEQTSNAMMQIVNADNMTGLEKLRKMFMNSYVDLEHIEFMKSVPNLLNNPRFLAIHISSAIEDVAPNYIYPVLKQGMEDGSIKCTCPMETAQAMVAISNIWMNPLIYADCGEDTNSKVLIMNKMFQALGVDLGDTELDKRIQGIMETM